MKSGSRREEGKDIKTAKPIIWDGWPMAETPANPPAELAGVFLYPEG